MIEDLSTVSIGELIRTMAFAVADAQAALDRSSFAIAELMSGQYAMRDRLTGELVDAAGRPTTNPVLVDSRVQFGYEIDAEGNRAPLHLSMMELGFTPTFYQLVDTIIEVRLALRVERTTARIDPTTGNPISDGGQQSQAIRITSQPLDATYTSSYNYKLEFASIFKTKIACVPPPPGLEERLRALTHVWPEQGSDVGDASGEGS
ncbi:MAG: hypothetical protein KC431_06210 [Myxococcales bacterium]|nr:hypothetical protein [Myxococcales bacterium]